MIRVQREASDLLIVSMCSFPDSFLLHQSGVMEAVERGLALGTSHAR